MLRRFTKNSADAKGASSEPAPVAAPVSAQNGPSPAAARKHEDTFLSLKVELHRHLIDRFNLSTLDSAFDGLQGIVQNKYKWC